MDSTYGIPWNIFLFLWNVECLKSRISFFDTVVEIGIKSPPPLFPPPRVVPPFKLRQTTRPPPRPPLLFLLLILILYYILYKQYFVVDPSLITLATRTPNV